MKEDTGQFRKMNSEEAKKLNENLEPGKKWVGIKESEIHKIRSMNRKQRRAWAAEKRKTTSPPT